VRFNFAEAGTDPSFYLPLARACEEAGYDGFIVPDSIAYPAVSDTKYPFNPDGSREFLEDKPFLDPFALIAALGAVTERLRFVTFVIKLPIRHPVLVAKQAASVSVLTGNRLGLGVGSSPWPEDYELVGVPWEGRGRRMDECIEVIRGLTAGGWFEHHGEVFDIPRTWRAGAQEGSSTWRRMDARWGRSRSVASSPRASAPVARGSRTQ
jgi:alkanesulfonate monooxygenase SsuD/methylene tetrahydromethanopterin reductase-like flavin-dependent oxidoreductase (luciferase family)